MASVFFYASHLTTESILAINQRQFARECPASADQAFGPAIRGCRSQFDFTLLFEETILTLLPCIVFILLVFFRAIALLREAPVTKTDWAVTAKTVSFKVTV